jgi:hypothetical protein
MGLKDDPIEALALRVADFFSAIIDLGEMDPTS